ELGARDDVLLDEFFAEGANHGSIRVARMNNGAADAVENGFHHQGSGGALEPGFGGGVRDLAFIAEGGNRADEDDGPLKRFGWLPAFEAAESPFFGDASDHFESPVDRRDEIDFDDLAEGFNRIDGDRFSLFVNLDGEAVTGDAGG